MPDYTVGDTVYKRFTTRQFSNGVPTTLAGTPVVSAYEDDSITQITAGITLGVDHDGVGGLNLLTIVVTGANGFEAGKSYDLVITTGTVGGVSVVGEVVWHFTLSAEAAATRLPAALVGGRMDSSIAADGLAADAITKIRSLVDGTADAGGTQTTMVDAALTEADDVWNGSWILFTSGAVANQCRLITNFVAATDTISFAPGVTASVGAGITYEILPNGAVDIQSWLGSVTALNFPNIMIDGRIDVDVGVLQSSVITAASIAANALTAGKIAASALDGKGDWNINKTGYSLSTAGILAIWHQALTAIVTAGSVGKLIKDEVTAARMAVLTDWINGGRLDLLLDAIPTTAMRGTDSAALASVATEVRLSELDAGTVGKAANQIDEIRTDTENIQSRLPAALVSSRMDATVDATGMESGAVDAIWAKTMTELAAVPGVTGTVLAALEWLFELSRNKGTQTSTTKTLRNDADDGDIATSAISDDGTTFTRGEWS